MRNDFHRPPAEVYDSNTIFKCINISWIKLITTASPPSLLVVVVLVFIICWLPYHIGRNLFAQVEDYETAMLSQNFNMASMVLCYLSASINPVVYNLMSRKYRAAAKRLYLLHRRPRQARSTGGGGQRQLTEHISTLTESMSVVWHVGSLWLHAHEFTSVLQFTATQTWGICFWQF